MVANKWETNTELEKAYEAILWLRDYLKAKQDEALYNLVNDIGDINHNRLMYRISKELLLIIEEAIGGK